MNTTFIIILLIFFFICSEFINKTCDGKSTTLTIYSFSVRLGILLLSIFSLLSIHTQYKDKYESNEFKKVLVFKQDSLISVQNRLINDLNEHLWHQHKCDNPVFDTDDYQTMQELQVELDSIYSTQL